MKTLQLLLCAVSACFLFPAASDARSHDQINSLLSDQIHGELSFGNLYKADGKFICPAAFGTFADPEDCDYYQVCMVGVSMRRKCKSYYSFSILRRACVPSLIAICGNDKSKTTTTTSGKTTATTSGITKATTPSDEDFSCPNFMGSFPHSRDCSKYYSCMMYRFSMKTCPETQLFDAVKSSCKPADQVNCGTRQRPGSTTPDIVTETQPDISTTETSTVTETKTDVITTTTSPTEDTTTTTTPVITTTPIITTTEDTTTDTPTTPVITTTEDFPTGPPDTDCDEEDVDCIIDETGDITKWFKCPEDMRSYVHPSSDKLFIFCKNWIPKVKKCGMDMIFSENLSTCIEVKYILYN